MDIDDELNQQACDELRDICKSVVFNDDDMKRLKFDISHDGEDRLFSRVKLRALLARLEAAENVLQTFRLEHAPHFGRDAIDENHCDGCRAYEVWRSLK